VKHSVAARLPRERDERTFGSSQNVAELLERATAAVADQPFLISESETLSYAQFKSRVDQAAATWHLLGVRKGDRVAFMVENRPDFLWAWLGLAKIGGILVAVNTRWQTGEIEYLLNLTESRLALITDQFGQAFRPAAKLAPALEQILTLPTPGGASPGDTDEFPRFTHFMNQAGDSAPWVDVNGDDEISFISTSGTTGRPKAVVQTHQNYVLTGEGYAQWVGLTAGERLYLCLPLFHINSQAYTVMGAIAARATIVLVERFSASRFWADMARYDIDVFNFIGSMMAVLIKRDPGPEETQHHVRLTYGGPALSGQVREQAEKRFNVKIISGIGMSENTFGLIESIDGERRPGSLGRVRQHPDPRIVNEARVVDDKGNAVPAGETGELIFRNPVLMKGYYRDPEQTAATVHAGWLHTGDLVRRDEDGFFYYVDRKKDIVRVRGENVAPAEVEQLLSRHPAVLEAAVIGVPSELTEDDVAAFIVAQVGRQPEAEELIAWCAGQIAPFKVPKYVWLVESLPKTETQRVEKQRLRETADKLLRQ
jgi:carnitine-CoA ligase